MPIFIIEHLEPEIWEWCLIEYKHISEIVGKENLWFTNAKEENKELQKCGKVIKQSVNELKLKNACILDPEADKTLNPKEAKRFSFFIFGGILGNYPQKKRTKEELTIKLKNISARNIGKGQMSTDNAVYVVHEILKGTSIEEMEFKDGIEIETGKGESVMLPYKYRILNKKPLVSKELIGHLKKEGGF